MSVAGWLYGDRHRFFIQFFAAVTIIVYDALATFIILKVISIFTPLRMPDDELEIGDLAAHDEQAYPPDEGYERVGEYAGVGAGASSAASAPTASAPTGEATAPIAGETR